MSGFRKTKRQGDVTLGDCPSLSTSLWQLVTELLYVPVLQKFTMCHTISLSHSTPTMQRVIKDLWVGPWQFKISKFYLTPVSSADKTTKPVKVVEEL